MPSPAALRRQEAGFLTVAVLGSSGLAWLTLAGSTPRPLPAGSGSLAVSLGVATAMWLLMMAAMMLPAVLPWILVFARLTMGRPFERGRLASMFLGGYMAVWGAFALAAAALQVLLQRIGALALPGPALPATIGGFVLVGVGVFQLSGLKETCLSRCRSPMSFFLASWRDGPAGAFRMGAGHGRFCLGCCWALMIAAFALGAMNLLWMAGLTAVMVAEKLLPRGPLFGRLVGIASILAGLWLAV